LIPIIGLHFILFFSQVLVLLFKEIFMELTNTLKKGIILDTFNILSATAALVLSLIVYAMHDYFNLFGVKHAVVFTILIFYGLAATGYYMFYFKNRYEYKLPTVATRLVSLVFYTSIGVAVFFCI
jgi:hypothetical protein